MLGADPVPVSTDRLDDGTFAKFLSKGMDVDLKSFSTGLRPFSPNQRKDLLVRQGPIGMPHQDAENDKLLVGQRNMPSIEKDFMTGHIDDQPIELSLVKRECLVTDCFVLGPAENGTNS